MVQIVGKYQHERSENLDAYFYAVGVPFIPRKMMQLSSPAMEISCENDTWTIKTSTVMRTVELKFRLGEEYIETMPSGDQLKNVTTLEGNTLKTISTLKDKHIQRLYEFSDDGIILTLKEETHGTEAKRHFRRLP